jgi:hypothetical protein
MSNDAKVDSGLPRSSNLPSAIIENDLLSETCLAKDCFTDQRFSNKLQAFMVGYVNSILSNYSVHK